MNQAKAISHRMGHIINLPKAVVEIKKMLKIEGRDDIEALEEAHRFIAVPDVAGHPTGGAIDLTSKI